MENQRTVEDQINTKIQSMAKALRERSSTQKPSQGRVVLYMGPGTSGVPGTPGHFGPQTYPATVLGVVGDHDCDLFVMTYVGHMTLRGIPYSEEPKPGHWSWPPNS